MATSQLKTMSLPAAADLSGKEGYAVKVNTSGQAAVQASANAGGIGVIVANPTLPTAAGGATSVALPGQVVKVQVGGAITVGDKLGIDGSGLFKTHASGPCWGYALQTSTTSGQFIDAVLIFSEE